MSLPDKKAIRAADWRFRIIANFSAKMHGIVFSRGTVSRWKTGKTRVLNGILRHKTPQVRRLFCAIYMIMLDLEEVLVRRRGLEPLCLAALAPQASASANFATSAWSLRTELARQERPVIRLSV